MSTPRSGQALTAALAQALGIPRNAYRAVLTLESHRLPVLDVSMYATDSQGRFVIDCVKDEMTGDVAERVRSVQFKLRLEPFEP